LPLSKATGADQAKGARTPPPPWCCHPRAQTHGCAIEGSIAPSMAHPCVRAGRFAGTSSPADALYLVLVRIVTYSVDIS
jgi:hypothetical protein